MCKMLNTFAKIRIIFDIRMTEAKIIPYRGTFTPL